MLTSLIKEMLGKWGEMQSFIEKYHPDKEVANFEIKFSMAIQYFTSGTVKMQAKKNHWIGF